MGGKSSKSSQGPTAKHVDEDQVSQISWAANRRASAEGSNMISPQETSIPVNLLKNEANQPLIQKTKIDIKPLDAHGICLTTLESILALLVSSERFNQLLEDEEAIQNRLVLPQNQDRSS